MVNTAAVFSAFSQYYPGKNTGVGCHSLLQRIFPTQGTNPGLLHCRKIFYHLRHHGSPYIIQNALSYVVAVYLLGSILLQLHGL